MCTVCQDHTLHPDPQEKALEQERALEWYWGAQALEFQAAESPVGIPAEALEFQVAIRDSKGHLAPAALPAVEQKEFPEGEQEESEQALAPVRHRRAVPKVSLV